MVEKCENVIKRLKEEETKQLNGYGPGGTGKIQVIKALIALQIFEMIHFIKSKSETKTIPNLQFSLCKVYWGTG